MQTPDDPDPPRTLPRTTKHLDELSKLGRSWFAEARQQSERDDVELEAWRREGRKWTVFNKRSRFSDDLDASVTKTAPPDKAPDR